MKTLTHEEYRRGKLLERIDNARVSAAAKDLATSMLGFAMTTFGADECSVFWDEDNDSITFEEDARRRQGRGIELYGGDKFKG